MKRQDLIRHVESYGCKLLREGGKHSVFFNPDNNQTTAIPRHREINNFIARKISRDLGIPEPTINGEIGEGRSFLTVLSTRPDVLVSIRRFNEVEQVITVLSFQLIFTFDFVQQFREVSD